VINNCCSLVNVFCSDWYFQLTNVPLTGSLGEPIKMSAMGPRLSTDEPMRNSAEAYLKGSLDVSGLLSRSIHLCVW